MAVSTIQLTTSDLKKKKEELENLNTQLKNDIKKLDAIEQTLMSMWEGDASKEFHKVYVKDGVAFDKFTELVTKYAGALEQIMALYQKAEQENVQIAKKR